MTHIIAIYYSWVGIRWMVARSWQSAYLLHDRNSKHGGSARAGNLFSETLYFVVLSCYIYSIILNNMQQVKITVRLSSPNGVAHELFQSAVTQLDPQTARAASQFWHERQGLKRICGIFWPTLIVEEVVSVEEL